MTLKVFTVRGRGYYGAGIAIVVAKDEADARQLAAEEARDPTWRTDYAKGDVAELEVRPTGPRGVIDHFEYGE
jgi:hypothetical protein